MSRVVLAPLRDEDSPRLFAWINDRELVTLSAPFEPVAEGDHRHWFDEVRRREDVAIFGIRTADDDELIGSCQLLDIDREAGVAKLQIRIGEPRGRDRGLGSEAVGKLLDHAFGELGLRRVELDVFATNERAIRVYEKVGFRREGVRAGDVTLEGEPIDVVEMAVERDSR